jgi:hypothetical protein
MRRLRLTRADRVLLAAMPLMLLAAFAASWLLFVDGLGAVPGSPNVGPIPPSVSGENRGEPFLFREQLHRQPPLLPADLAARGWIVTVTDDGVSDELFGWVGERPVRSFLFENRRLSGNATGRGTAHVLALAFPVGMADEIETRIDAERERRIAWNAAQPREPLALDPPRPLARTAAYAVYVTGGAFSEEQALVEAYLLRYLQGT